ncbi:hypothetical protein C8J57DRAFT_1495510 [Mycena rebaudengoi]|nr:hypothetical protein C8J57DRAFT_1495510 [Mycena rebaudengoi]
MPPASAIESLLGLRDLINSALQVVSEEWTSHESPPRLEDPLSPSKDHVCYPSPRLFDATKTAIGAAGMLQVLLKDPKDYLIEFAASAASLLRSTNLWLSILSPETHIPKILHRESLDGNQNGLAAQELAEGYEINKCARMMRLLATNHIFSQTGPQRFSNNRISTALIGNNPLANYIDLRSRTTSFSCSLLIIELRIVKGGEWYSSSQHLVEAFKDQSIALDKAVFTQD